MSILDFFQTCGPSARDCYAFCEAIDDYKDQVRERAKRTPWGTITKALTSRADLIGLEEGSHKIILISPNPENRSLPLPSIITKSIGALLHELDSEHRWQNARQLYRTLRADPESRATAGKLFESAFHSRCVKGQIDLQLESMAEKPGGKVNDIFITTRAESVRHLRLPRQQHVYFNRQQPIEALAADHYYQPKHGTQSSYDSFIFYPESAEFILFQVTDAKSHSVVLKGIQDLFKIAQWLGVQNPGITFVAVVPEGVQVQFEVLKIRDFEIDMCWLEVTEEELYVIPNF